jgi:biopolymer transport protein ExbD
MNKKAWNYPFCNFFLLLAGCFLLINCSEELPPKENILEQSVVIVKVPPFYDHQLSRAENHRRFDSFLFPLEEIPDSIPTKKTPAVIPETLPNYDGLLFVSIDETGKLKLNSENEGDVAETKFLKERLTALFREREKAGVYQPGNWKVVKAVGIETAHSIKYGDFIKVVDAVRQSGADPIVLLLDDDARPKLNTNTSKNTEKSTEIEK